MVYLVVYDISDDRCRSKISTYLEGKGQRIQESVFECHLEEVDIRAISGTLQQWVQNQGNVRIYPVCANCIQKSIGIGNITESVGRDGYAIF